MSPNPDTLSWFRAYQSSFSLILFAFQISNNIIFLDFGLTRHLISPYQINHNNFIYRVLTSVRSCNKVGHLFWFTILAQHETNDVILYIHSIHKHRGNSIQRQNYKMTLKQRSLNWINSMQVKKILFTNVFFPDHYAG